MKQCQYAMPLTLQFLGAPGELRPIAKCQMCYSSFADKILDQLPEENDEFIKSIWFNVEEGFATTTNYKNLIKKIFFAAIEHEYIPERFKMLSMLVDILKIIPWCFISYVKNFEVIRRAQSATMYEEPIPHAGIVCDVISIQLDVFYLKIHIHITVFLIYGVTICRIPARFLFDIEERVHVILEQLIGSLREMPHFVHT